jgi:hypothetical protein
VDVELCGCWNRIRSAALRGFAEADGVSAIASSLISIHGLLVQIRSQLTLRQQYMIKSCAFKLAVSLFERATGCIRVKQKRSCTCFSLEVANNRRIAIDMKPSLLIVYLIQALLLLSHTML